MSRTSFHLPHRLTPEQINELFAEQRAEDRIGRSIHLFLAIGACFFGAWSTTFTEWAALPVLVCFLVRITGWHKLLEPLAFDRVLRLLLAWGGWIGLSVIWSAGRRPGSHDWLHDVQSLRFLVLPIIVWPVMDRRSWMIAAMVAGIVCGQFSQLVHLLTLVLHTSWTPWNRMPGRISGWWDPVVGGSVLCAGLGLWLGAAAFASNVRARWAGLMGAAVTLGCIGLTGTRGAWIGAGLLLAATLTIGLVRRGSSRRALGPFGASLVAAAVIGAAGVLLLPGHGSASRSGLGERLTQGIQEVRGAFGPQGYETDTGLRIAMWRWGIAAFRSHPIVGVGAGGFQPWVRAQNSETADRLNAPIGAAAMVHAHAHSWYIHTLATLGLIGFGLLAALVVCAIVAGFPRGSGSGSPISGLNADAPESIGRSVLEAMRDFGPPLALLGLACAGLFDTITINQQTAYFFYMLVGFCLPSRPYEPAAPALAVPGAREVRS